MLKVKRAKSRSGLSLELDYQVEMQERAERLGLVLGRSTRDRALCRVYRQGHINRALCECETWREVAAYLRGWEHAQKYGKVHGK
jgi:hypothetical protein